MTDSPRVPNHRPATVSRRGFAAGLGALAAGLAATRATAAQDATAEASPVGSPVSAEGWSFTDGAGKTVTLPEVPRRIVADVNAASALADFGITPIALSGWAATTDAAWGSLDRDIPVINADAGSGEPDLEKLLALEPDLFVTILWTPDDPYTWTFTSPEQLAAADRIVPVIGISVAGVADANMRAFEELAGALGADLASPALTEARATYEATREEFTALAAKQDDLVAAFGFISDTGLNIANPPDWADLLFFSELGLHIVTPDVDAGEFWDKLSPELANTYPADILYQSTASIYTVDEIAANPVYETLPAVAAGQLGPWNQDFISSYQGLTDAMRNVMGTLATAKRVRP
ncbi:MAG: ABC transporter substrate-binding protein [Thermomicrobiales bacterium]